MAQSTPDLAAVLSTLSKYAQTGTQSTPHAHNPERQSTSPLSHNARNATNPQRSSTPSQTVDPGTITAWPAGLRYMHKAAAADGRIGSAVRRLIQSQHDHEKQWWNGRLALIQRQKDRVQGQQKLDDVLRAVGGRVNAAPVVTDDATELARYDGKVHAAMIDMTQSVSDELRVMKIPFFCTAESRVVDDTKTPASGDTVTKAQLIKLQVRMLEFLEDMFKED